MFLYLILARLAFSLEERQTLRERKERGYNWKKNNNDDENEDDDWCINRAHLSLLSLERTERNKWIHRLGLLQRSNFITDQRQWRAERR